MIATVALILAFAGVTPSVAQEPAAQPTPHIAQEAVAEHSKGRGDGVDFMHHILDSREIEGPKGALHLPPAHSWQVGPVDMTPTKHVVFLGVAALLTLALLLSTAAVSTRAERGVPEGRRHNAVEALVLFVRDRVVMDNIGRDGAKFAPFILTLFFFILFANLLGLVPWGSTATANVSVTAALALATFVVVEVGGMLKLGPAGYLKTVFYTPPGMGKPFSWIMAVVLSPIELVSKLTKPFALAIRLMANMTAGHIVLLAIISLIFVFGSVYIAVVPVLMGVAISMLEIFVAFLQAYIFALLSSVFIGLIRHAH